PFFSDELIAPALQETSGHVTAWCCDVSKESDIRDLATRIGDRFGRLDVLVNNIGQSDRGLVSELAVDHLKTIFDQNVVSTLRCSQAMLPLLESSGGSVVNVSSLAGKVGARYLGAYVAAKHALSGITQQMRLEWRDKGIHVAIVSPGPIRRPDEGTRYSEFAKGSLPEHATRPGGGTRVKGLRPERVARAVLDCARKKRTDVILPGYLRLLITIGNAFPRLGDWLLLKFTRKGG
ncbi:MAG: SDR family NAD(P)-dependent oxidoreductase, partial [Planctomycetota bacterium]